MNLCIYCAYVPVGEHSKLIKCTPSNFNWTPNKKKVSFKNYNTNIWIVDNEIYKTIVYKLICGLMDWEYRIFRNIRKVSENPSHNYWLVQWWSGFRKFLCPIFLPLFLFQYRILLSNLSAIKRIIQIKWLKSFPHSSYCALYALSFYVSRFPIVKACVINFQVYIRSFQ